MPEVSTEIPAKQYWEWVSRTFIRMKILSYYAVIWLMTECLSWILINPFTHKISLLILLTVCNTLLTIFVLEFSIEQDGNPMIDIFLCCQCLLSRYCIWYCKEKFYLGHLWEWKGKVPCNFNFMPLKKAKQQVNLPYHIYLCWTEHLLKVKPIHKCVLVLNPLTPASDYIYFLLTISPLNHTLPSQEQRKWSQTKEALDCWTNSPCQYVRKCIENRTENMHRDVGV